jgi:phosphatidylserine/phosphatidylglycerophosphate/cardiolipin synthase-like enzyme
VHSKVVVVDDDLVFAGSSNLSNRSMVLDTECNLAIEARGSARIRRSIAGIRERLLAEHLGVTPERIAGETARHGSLIAAIEAGRGAGRYLERLDPVTTPEQEALVPLSALVDPEATILPERFSAQRSPPVVRTLTLPGWVALLRAALSALWRFTRRLAHPHAS